MSDDTKAIRELLRKLGELSDRILKLELKFEDLARKQHEHKKNS